ncbi:hypothetical protein IEQ34_019903 [Dendrobium chrysotoxum]|uniref:Uncharacterized protein n=1 Tax=Dendrobium chrysotoxum TaxID=161865 RepID=A0AAV7G9V0_DENCH|nr:hypothetical protein IEQ34_019903 [Dendrobium chrysotoxum]
MDFGIGNLSLVQPFEYTWVAINSLLPPILNVDLTLQDNVGNVDYGPLNLSIYESVLSDVPIIGSVVENLEDKNEAIIDIAISLISKNALIAHLALNSKGSCVDQSSWLDECYSSGGQSDEEDNVEPSDDF